jgi:hypothetical protein
MSISSHNVTHNRRRYTLSGEPSVPRPQQPRGLLTRMQTKEMIHNWDQQIVRLRHRVEELEEQNEVLRDLLKDAVHICDEATAAGRPPAASSAFTNVYRSVIFQSVSLRSQLQQQWRRLLTVTHLPLPYRREVSPSVGWPFEPVLYGPASVGSVGASPNSEQITVDAGPASSSAAFDPSAHETTRARPCGASPHSIATRR